MYETIAWKTKKPAPHPGKVKSHKRHRKLTRPELNSGFCRVRQMRVPSGRVCLPRTYMMLVHRRLPSGPSLPRPVPNYTPELKETIWNKVSCLRKQDDGMDQASNHRPSDLKSNSLTTPPRPQEVLVIIVVIATETGVNCRQLLTAPPRKFVDINVSLLQELKLRR